MGKELDRAMKKILHQPASQSLFVPIDMYISHMQAMTERIHELEQKTSTRNIRKIAEAAYQKQEQNLNNLRDDCVRMLSLMRDKGLLTQEELNKAARDG